MMGTPADIRIGCNVALLRKERGLSCAELARMVRIPDAHLAACEAGEQRMPASLIHDLAMAMDVTISALFACPDLSSQTPQAQPQPRPH